jgi:hypothetical protein
MPLANMLAYQGDPEGDQENPLEQGLNPVVPELLGKVMQADLALEMEAEEAAQEM